MNTPVNTDVPPFDPETFGTEHSFAVIGEGDIGGKASGLRQIRDEVLPRFDSAEFDGVEVEVPRVVVVATGVFSAFMERNGLWAILEDDLPDSKIARVFQGGELPTDIREQLRSLLTVVHTPLVIRPSSYLEDAHQPQLSYRRGCQRAASLQVRNLGSDFEIQFR